MSGKKNKSRQKRIKYPPVRNQQTINDFVARIIFLLGHFKIKASQLSRYAEINYDYLQQILRGTRNPSICHEQNIAEGFGISVSQFRDYNYIPPLTN